MRIEGSFKAKNTLAETPPATLWFSDTEQPYIGSEPYFYDPKAFPWVAEVEQQWRVIHDELHEHVSDGGGQLQPYIDRDMTSRADSWKTLGLMFWSEKSEENCQRFPRTWALLKDIPNLTAVSLNKLEPNTTIKLHIGNTNAIIRCHLGLEVPAPAPQCAFRVGDQTRSWEEGKMLLFCDAHMHTAWNNSERDRYILVIDVLHPQYASQKLKIAARVLAAIKLMAHYQRRQWWRTYLSSRWAKSALFWITRTYIRTKLALSTSTHG